MCIRDRTKIPSKEKLGKASPLEKDDIESLVDLTKSLQIEEQKKE